MDRIDTCMDHSGVLQSLSDHSGRIETVTRGLDDHLKEHRRNSVMILVSTITSSIAAGASVIVALFSLL